MYTSGGCDPESVPHFDKTMRQVGGCGASVRALPWEIVLYVVRVPGCGDEDKPGGRTGSEADAANGSSYDSSLEGPAFVSGATPIAQLRSGIVWD